jgi:hypothetical protein
MVKDLVEALIQENAHNKMLAEAAEARSAAVEREAEYEHTRLLEAARREAVRAADFERKWYASNTAIAQLEEEISKLRAQLEQATGSEYIKLLEDIFS